MTSGLVAVLLAATAGWVALGRPGPARRTRSLARERRPRPPRFGRDAATDLLGARGIPPIAGAWALGGAVAVVGLVLLASPAGALVAGGGATVAARSARRLAAERDVRSGQARVRRLLRGLAVELRSGAAPTVALERSWSPPGQRHGPAPGLLGADVPGLLRSTADLPGHAPLRRLGVLWAVADATGAGLAEGVDRLADELDEDDELRREVDAVLAGPRASARLMAVLPLMGVLLGTGLGGDPAGFLLHDPVGEACLLVGAALVLAGLRWTRVLADAAVGAAARP